MKMVSYWVHAKLKDPRRIFLWATIRANIRMFKCDEYVGGNKVPYLYSSRFSIFRCLSKINFETIGRCTRPIYYIDITMVHTLTSRLIVIVPAFIWTIHEWTICDTIYKCVHLVWWFDNSLFWYAHTKKIVISFQVCDLD